MKFDRSLRDAESLIEHQKRNEAEMKRMAECATPMRLHGMSAFGSAVKFNLLNTGRKTLNRGTLPKTVQIDVFSF
jgi:hypothetical protein